MLEWIRPCYLQKEAQYNFLAKLPKLLSQLLSTVCMQLNIKIMKFQGNPNFEVIIQSFNV